jgi:hypothetical protein
VAGTIDIRLVADVKDAIKDVGKFQKDTNKKLGSVVNSLGQIKTAAIAAVGALVSIAAVRALKDTVNDVAELGDSIAKTSRKLGVGAEALQELRFAAKRSGVEVNTFDMGLQRFTRRAAEAAAGTGEARQALAQLGVQLRDSNGRLKPAEELLGDVAEAFKEIPDQSERVRLAFKLFDSEGVALVNLLDQGKEGLQGLRKEFRDLGGVISEDGTRASEDYVDALTDLNVAFSGLKQEFIIGILPALTDFIKLLTDASKSIRLFIRDIKFTKNLKKNIDDINKSIKQSGNVFADYLKSVGKSNDLIEDGSEKQRRLGDSARQTNQQFKQQGILIDNIAEKLLNLPQEILKPGAATELLKKGLKIPIEADLTSLQGQVQGILGVTQSILTGAKGAQEAIKGAIGFVTEIFLPGFGKQISEIIGILSMGPAKVRQLVRDFLAAIPQILESIIVSVIPLITEVLSNAGEFVRNVIEAIGFGVVELLRAAPEIARQLLEAIPEVVDGLIRGALDFAAELIGAVPEIAVSFVETLIDALLANIPVFGDIFGDDEDERQKRREEQRSQLEEDKAFDRQRRFQRQLEDLELRQARRAKDLEDRQQRALADAIKAGRDQAFINGLQFQQMQDTARLEGEFQKERALFLEDQARAEERARQDAENARRRAERDTQRRREREGGFLDDLTDFFTNPIGTIAGAAEGGMIPKGFPRDTFPLRGTSGEMIIPPGDTERLGRFLDDQEKGIEQGTSSPGVLDMLKLIATRLDALESRVVVNVGNKTIVDEVRKGIEDGRVVFT